MTNPNPKPIQRPFLAPSAYEGGELEAFEALLQANLETRIRSHESYSRDEMEKVAERPFRLFPPGYRLTDEQERTMRALAFRSRVSLRPPHAIRSHRRVIGPVIVAVKRVVWRFLNFFLAGTFEQIEDFNRHLIRSHAEQLAETRRLRELLTGR